MNVIYIIRFDVKKEKSIEFSSIMMSVKSDLPKTDGCVAVNIYQSLQNPLQYTLVEQWQSKQHHAQHLKNLVDSGVWAHVASLLFQDPPGDYYSVL